MNINTKQCTLFKLSPPTAPLLPRDHNNCSSIALPMFLAPRRWQDITWATDKQSEEGYLPRAKICTWTNYSTLKSYKQSNNTKEKQHNPKWHWQLIHRYNMMIQKNHKLYICNNNMTTLEHLVEITMSQPEIAWVIIKVWVSKIATLNYENTNQCRGESLTRNVTGNIKVHQCSKEI